MKTTIPVETPDGTPNAGARQPKGKSSECDAVLLGHDPGARTAVAVKTATEDKGVARRCIDKQVQGDGGANSPNGDPKRRSRNSWGVDEPHPGK